jgi:hypothetical protein
MQSVTYYPEMGEKPVPALFKSFHVMGSTMGLGWATGQHDRALAAFKALRIRPQGMELSETITGGKKWGACCTYAAFRKLYEAGLVCHEQLLD